MLKLYFQDTSSEAAYQASLVTRDRALAAQQQSIDLLQRLLAQMGNDPLIVQARESLSKILANPSVITDEVFNNIMSKTQEVMDADYDSQISQFIDNARSKGVTGDTLGIQLQKAKNARASGMAAAYRDAIVQRSKEGLTTSIEAVNTTFNALNTLMANQRVATEDLVNVYQSVVPEPFRNYGAPAEALPAGAAGAGGAGGTGGARYSGVGASPTGGTPFGETWDATSEWNADYPNQTPPSPTGQLPPLTDVQRFGITPKAPIVPTVPGTTQPAVPGQPVATGTEQQQQLAALQQAIQKTFAGGGAPVTLGANLTAGVKQSAQNAVSSMMAKSPVSALTSTALAGTTGLGGAAAPSAGILPAAMAGVAGVPQAILDMSRYNVKAPTMPSGYTSQPSATIPIPEGSLQKAPTQMTTVQGPGLAPGFETAGGAKEAKRAADMAKAGYDVIGGTSGAGYRKSTISAKEQEAAAAKSAEAQGFWTPTLAGTAGNIYVTGYKWNDISASTEEEKKKLAKYAAGKGITMGTTKPTAPIGSKYNPSALPSAQLKNVLGQYAPGSQYA